MIMLDRGYPYAIASVVLIMPPCTFILSCHHFFQRTVFQMVLTINEILYSYFGGFLLVFYYKL